RPAPPRRDSLRSATPGPAPPQESPTPAPVAAHRPDSARHTPGHTPARRGWRVASVRARAIPPDQVLARCSSLWLLHLGTFPGVAVDLLPIVYAACWQKFTASLPCAKQRPDARYRVWPLLLQGVEEGLVTAAAEALPVLAALPFGAVPVLAAVSARHIRHNSEKNHKSKDRHQDFHDGFPLLPACAGLSLPLFQT